MKNDKSDNGKYYKDAVLVKLQTFSRNPSHRSVKNATKSGSPKSANGDEMVSEVKEIVKRDARYTVRDVAQLVGISLSRAHYFLQNILYVRKITARWILLC